MIKWIIKWTLRLLIGAVLLLVLLLIFKDSILRSLAEQRIRSETGLEARIGKFSSGIFTPVVTIEDLKLYNPPDFGGTLFLNVPEIHVEVNSLALAQRRLRITLLRLNVAEFDIVRNAAGQTNIFSLANKMQPSLAKKSGPQTRVGDLEFVGIDVLNLSFGKVKFLDLKDSTNSKEIVVNLQNQIFPNVKSDAGLYGITAMLWLRSGGKLSQLSPMVPGVHTGHRAQQAENNVPPPAGQNQPATQK